MRYDFSPRFQGRAFVGPGRDKVEVFIDSVEYEIDTWGDGTRAMNPGRVLASVTPDGPLVEVILDVKTYAWINRLIDIDNGA
jgi:hypothetical protein